MSDTKPTMGIGKLGESFSMARHRSRFTLSGEFPSGKFDEQFVKVASRPNLKIEESEINYLSTKTWIPGKQERQTITTTYYDFKSEDVQDLYNILAKTWDLTEGADPQQQVSPDNYGSLSLKLYRCSWEEKTLLEEWKMTDVYPVAMDFGELDHSSSDVPTLEITWSYGVAEYVNLVNLFTNVTTGETDEKPLA